MLLEYDKQSKALLAESTTISVDVMTITGTTASPISQTRMIFYDTEILAIVHRSKSRSSGLVSNVVWGWEGKRATLGEREQRKLQELAKRYGTSAASLSFYLVATGAYSCVEYCAPEFGACRVGDNPRRYIGHSTGEIPTFSAKCLNG